MVKNLLDLMSKFKDEQACRDFLVKQRWNGKPKCPFCGHRRSYKIEAGKRFKCANQTCYKKFSVTVGTVFEASNIPLKTWFAAMYLVTAHKKGISSVQMAKDLGVTQKTAWFMNHRIRESLKESNPLWLEKEVQGDEIYIGGTEANKHKNKRAKDLSEASARKMPIVGLIETGGRVVTEVMPWITKKNISELVQKHVDKKATFVTDGAPFYFKVGKKYDHVTVNHMEGQFKVGKHHTNGIENYWSLLSRGIYGIYHQVSDKHLQRYCDEFSFRFNSRKLYDGLRWTIAIQQVEGRLTYKQLINAQVKENQGERSVETIETEDEI